MLRFFSGYDAWGTTATEMQGPGFFTHAANGTTATGTRGAHSARCLMAGLDQGVPWMANPGGSVNGGCIGTGFYAAVAYNRTILGFHDSAVFQVELRLRHTDHKLEVFRGGPFPTADVSLGTSPNALVLSTWHMVEMEVVIHNSAGTVKVWVNNELVIDLSGVDTQATANASFNQFYLGGASEGTWRYDDTYFLDNVAGDERIAHLGDCKVITRIAVPGNGDHTGSTPSSGSDRGAMVDDATPDGDTTYNAFTAAAQADAYHHDVLGVTGQIWGVRVSQRLRKTDTGSATAQIGIRLDGTDYYLATVFYPSTDYEPYHQVLGQSPDTSDDFTVAEVDDAQSLVKRVA